MADGVQVNPRVPAPGGPSSQGFRTPKTPKSDTPVPVAAHQAHSQAAAANASLLQTVEQLEVWPAAGLLRESLPGSN